jgi:hypothetical protein
VPSINPRGVRIPARPSTLSGKGGDQSKLIRNTRKREGVDGLCILIPSKEKGVQVIVTVDWAQINGHVHAQLKCGAGSHRELN